MCCDRNKYQEEFQNLVDIIKTLRGPNGCPWDKKQKPEDVKTYLLEEVYETIEAIDNKNYNNIQEELGDLLLLIIFLADYYEKEGKFDLSNVIQDISNKLVRRHPHVFADENLETPEEVIKNWDRLKKKERKGKRKNFFDGIPKSAPALLRSYLFFKKAYRFHKIKSLSPEKSIRNIKDELKESNLKDDKTMIGKLLFQVVELSAKLGVEPESALLFYLEDCSKNFIDE